MSDPTNNAVELCFKCQIGLIMYSTRLFAVICRHEAPSRWLEVRNLGTSVDLHEEHLPSTQAQVLDFSQIDGSVLTRSQLFCHYAII